MSELSYVTYKIPAVADNFEKISQINSILYGKNVNGVSSATTADKVDDVKTTSEPVATDLTLEEIKVKIKEIKKDKGLPFVISVLDKLGVQEDKSLLKRVSKIKSSDYEKLLDLLDADVKDELEEDEFDDFADESDEPKSKVTVESVEQALKSYAKEKSATEAKALMQKHNVKNLADLPNQTPKVLSDLFEEILSAS